MARHREPRMLTRRQLAAVASPVIAAAAVAAVIGVQALPEGAESSVVGNSLSMEVQPVRSDPVPSQSPSVTPSMMTPSPVIPTVTPSPTAHPSTPRPRPSVSRSAIRKATRRVDLSSIVATAESYAGVPYVWGGETPSGFDCSGLVQWVYHMHGVAVRRTADQQYRDSVKTSSPRPGDLVFFIGSDGTAFHVGIYVSPGKMWAAPKPGDVVKLENIWSTRIVYGRLV
jgi:cell wall-associated NlpC family hydrolase